MYYAIKAVGLDLYVVMDGLTGAVTWGEKEDCMVFGLHSQAGPFARNNSLDYDWEVVEVDFGY